MTSKETTAQDTLLCYLSEVLNNCLTLSEIVQETQRSTTDNLKIQLSISELFSLYQATKLYYFTNHSNEKDIFLTDFFTVFDEFYFELKHFCFYETNPLRRNFKRVEKSKKELVILFEKIVADLD